SGERARRTTSWPASRSERAAAWPRPSVLPVMKTRAIRSLFLKWIWGWRGGTLKTLTAAHRLQRLETGPPAPARVRRAGTRSARLLRMRAAQCRLRAKHVINPTIKQDLLDQERRWLTMALNYEFAERLSDFTDEARRRAPKK